MFPVKQSKPAKLINPPRFKIKYHLQAKIKIKPMISSNTQFCKLALGFWLTQTGGSFIHLLLEISVTIPLSITDEQYIYIYIICEDKKAGHFKDVFFHEQDLNWTVIEGVFIKLTYWVYSQCVFKASSPEGLAAFSIRGKLKNEWCNPLCNMLTKHSTFSK